MEKRNSDDGSRGAPTIVRRQWSDLLPDLLHLIHSKLPPDHSTRRSGFGTVCKHWRKLHVSAGRIPTVGNHTFGIGTRLDRENLDNRIPPETRIKLRRSFIADINRGWWLLADSDDGKLFGCFNPLLNWPSSFIDLPKLTITQSYNPDQYPPPRIFTQFSSSPADPDWTLFVLHGGGKFSTLRRGQWWWRSYSYSGRTTGRPAAFGRDPNGGEFSVVFDNGDVLIFGIGWFPERMLLAASPPIPSLVDLSEAKTFLVRWKKQGKRMMLVRLREGRGKRVAVDSEVERDAIRRSGLAGAVWEIAGFGLWCYGFVAFCCPSFFYSVPVLRFSRWVLLFVNYVVPLF